MQELDLVRALKLIRPGAQWALSGTDYSGLQWLDSVQPMPTQAEVDAGLAQLNDPTFQLNQIRSQAVGLATDPTPNSKFVRAVLLVILDEVNLIRSLLVPAQPPRTPAQMKTAIQNKINGGAAD